MNSKPEKHEKQKKQERSELEKPERIKKTDESSNLKKRSIGIPLTAIGIVLLIILSPWLWYLNNFQSDNNPEVNVELEHYVNKVIDDIRNYIIFNATELISQNPDYNRNLTKFEDKLSKNLEKTILLNYQPYLIKEKSIEIIINFWTLDVRFGTRTINDLIRYPRIDTEYDEKLDFSTFDMYFDTSVPYSYIIESSLFISGKKRSDSDSEGEDVKSTERIVVIDEPLPLPHLFIEHKLSQFQNQAESAYSDLARMMRYMLTTLARMRMHNKEKSESEKSHKNFISEGDVELALNLALILEEALIFRTYDRASPKAIDKFFYFADDSDRKDNPTGNREWGSGERQNYFEYENRREFLSDPEERLMSVLISNYVNFGYIDPADLLGLYLVIDKGYRPAIISTPKDTRSILDERYDSEYLMDPRTPNDPTDTTNVEFITMLPKQSDSSFNFTGMSNNINEYWHYQNMELSINQEPNYLIFNKDFTVKGLNNPRGWYTTAILRPGTRTSIRPDVRPEDHDYRLEWKLKIQGKFNFDIGIRNEAQNSFNQLYTQKKTIRLDFPIDIFIWSYKDVKITSLYFEEFNTGVNINNKWEITSESTLVEYFERKFWPDLKPIITLGIDEIYSILPFIVGEIGFEYYDGENKRYINNLLAGYSSVTSNLIADILLYQTRALKQTLSKNLNSFWEKFNVFMAEYFLDYLDQYDEEFGLLSFKSQPQFPHPSFTPWLSELGYEITLHYDPGSNIVNITVIHDSGYFSLLISGYNTTQSELELILNSKLEYQDVFELSTTVTSSDSSKPKIFADGLLFNNYKFTTRAFPKPTSTTGNGLSENSEQLLITRSKFDKLTSVAELELPLVPIDPDNDESSIILTILVPEENKALVSNLENDLNSIDLKIEPFTDIDEPIQIKIQILNILEEIGDALLNWLEKNGPNLKLVIDFSLKLEIKEDSTNLTIYLPESAIAKKFINWFSDNGLDLLSVLTNSNILLPDLAKLFDSENPYLSHEDLAKIDFEFHNQKLDHQFQKNMKTSSNLLNLYTYPGSIGKNLELIIVYSGESIANIDKWPVNKELDGKDGNLETLSQVYYTYQPESSIESQTYLLLGTTWFVKGSGVRG